jgi:hypothetical protein
MLCAVHHYVFGRFGVARIGSRREFRLHFDIGITDQLKSGTPANIHVLDQDDYEIDGVRFQGTTLWTDFRLYGAGEARFSRQTAKRSIDDFITIRNGDRQFTPEDSVRLHETSRAWLLTELLTPFHGPTVVVTHHLPATPSIASRYRNDPLNPAFASNLEDVIGTYRPELWVHGHTHVACDPDFYFIWRDPPTDWIGVCAPSSDTHTASARSAASDVFSGSGVFAA